MSRSPLKLRDSWRSEGRGWGKLGFVELIDLCRQNEVALRQAVDLVCPCRDLDSSPSKKNVWVVALFLSEFTCALYKPESSTKVGKIEDLRDVVFFNNVPPIDLLLK